MKETFKYNGGNYSVTFSSGRVFIDKLTEDEIAELWMSVGWGISFNRNKERILLALKEGSTNVYIARSEGNLVGLLSCTSDGYNVWLSYLLVHDYYQNNTIGSQLMTYFLNDFKGYRIFVQTEDASEFFKKFGFEENGVLLRKYTGLVKV